MDCNLQKLLMDLRYMYQFSFHTAEVILQLESNSSAEENICLSDYSFYAILSVTSKLQEDLRLGFFHCVGL